MVGGRRRWLKGDIRKYLAELKREPPPAPQSDDEHLVTAAQLRAMLGNVSDMWLWRRLSRQRAATSTEG
jgi:hypothetical protein